MSTNDIDRRGGKDPAPTGCSPTSKRGMARGDVVGAVLGVTLLAAAFLVPHLHDATVSPVSNPARWGCYDFADAAPLSGRRLAHVGWGSPAAVAVAAAVVVGGPLVAHRLSWRPLLLVTWLTGFGLAAVLILVVGWNQGFASKFTSRDAYLHEVPRFGDIAAALHDFARRIPDHQPDSWNIQVAGHPPGAVLVFLGLDRIGLGGPIWAAAVCTVVGTSAAAAILITLRALDQETLARRGAPFLALAPAAIWIAVSADALFAAITAWGLALLALAASRTVRCPTAAAIGGGCCSDTGPT